MSLTHFKCFSASSIASALQYTDLPIVSSSTCLNIYGTFTDKQICASTSNGRSTCNVCFLHTHILIWKNQFFTYISINNITHFTGWLRWSSGHPIQQWSLDWSWYRLFWILCWLPKRISSWFHQSQQLPQLDLLQHWFIPLNLEILCIINKSDIIN